MRHPYRKLLLSVGVFGLGSGLSVTPTWAACEIGSDATSCASLRPALQQSPEAASVALFDLVNGDRTAGGLHPLPLRDDLNALAAAHSRVMAADGGIFHNDALFTATTKKLIGAETVGENVATNMSIEDAHRRLMASPGHRPNLMSPKFTLLGIGVVNVNGAWYITEVFVSELAAEPEAAKADPAAAQADPAGAKAALADKTDATQAEPPPARAPPPVPPTPPVTPDEPVPDTAPSSKIVGPASHGDASAPTSSTPQRTTVAVAVVSLVVISAATARTRRTH